MTQQVHKGGCHCGAVQFEVEAPADLVLYECNCSICAMSGFLHLEVEADRFRLLSGEDKLTTYTFNTGAAKHLFCSICGVKSFYVPRSLPNGYSVNFNCMEKDTVTSFEVRPFDGANWEQANAERPLSDEAK